MKGDFNMNTVVDLRKLSESIVSSTDLSRKSAQILNEIEENKNSKIIVKNNKPTAVIMSMSEYNHLIETWDNYNLLNMAVERLNKNDSKNDIDLNSLIEKEGFDKKELMKLKDEIEFD